MNEPVKTQPSAPPANESLEDKRKRLQEAKEKLEKLRAEDAKKRAVEVLELELKFEGEIGPRGSQFEIVETVDGPIVVRLGEGILYERFTASKVTPADVHDFVYPCVIHPAKEKYLEIVARRPDIASRVAHALMNLFGSRHKDDSGKF